MSPQSSTPWFRLYSEVLSDRKIQRVSSTTKQPIAMILGVWTVILAMANDSPQRGKLLISDGIPVTFGEIAAACGLADDDCQAILAAFSSMNMLYLDENEVYTVTQWDARQFTSDNSTERVRKYRERQKGENEAESPKTEHSNNGYTKRYSNVSETPPESESESESNGIIGKPMNGNGPIDKSGPRWQMREEFTSKSGIVWPNNKKDSDYFWSRIGALYEVAGRDVDIGKRLIRDSISKLKADNLTISDPGSLVKTARALVAKPKTSIGAK